MRTTTGSSDDPVRFETKEKTSDGNADVGSKVKILKILILPFIINKKKFLMSDNFKCYRRTGGGLESVAKYL